MKADQKVEAPSGGGSKKLIIIILALVLVLGAGGGGAAWFFLHGKADVKNMTKRRPRRKSQETGRSAGICAVELLMVNLQPGDAGTTSTCKSSRWKWRAGRKENVSNNMARCVARKLLLLSSKRAADINTLEGEGPAGQGNHCNREPFEDRGAAGNRRRVVHVLHHSVITSNSENHG
jgi:flagellar FliL protein